MIHHRTKKLEVRNLRRRLVVLDSIALVIAWMPAQVWKYTERPPLWKWLVIEFVPKSDSQVQKLLTSREDIFPNYTREGFESAFSACFTIRKSESVRDSERTLYLLERKKSS